MCQYQKQEHIPDLTVLASAEIITQKCKVIKAGSLNV